MDVVIGVQEEQAERLGFEEDPALESCWVDAEAMQSETVDGKDWVRVDVGWLDFPSTAVSSVAGPDEAGGAYWVAQNGAAVPHVLRYKNESVDIVWQGATASGGGSF